MDVRKARPKYHRLSVNVPEDEYYIFKSFAEWHGLTLSMFLRKAGVAEVRRRAKDYWWKKNRSKESIQKVADAINNVWKSLDNPDAFESAVYFIKDEQANLIKIGFSTNPAMRVHSMSTDNPHDLQILFVLPGDRSTETAIHASFAHCRVGGEWHRPTDDLLAFIDSLREKTGSAFTDSQRMSLREIRARSEVKALEKAEWYKATENDVITPWDRERFSPIDSAQLPPIIREEP